jgi:hypothetical protein
MASVADKDTAKTKQELISGALDVMSVKRVYGEPYEKNGLTVIPAAIVGGLGGNATDGKEGAKASQERGFGLMARPSGAWIIDDGQVTWRPAIDVNRIVLGGQIIAFTAIFMAGRILLARAQHRGSGHAARFQPLWSIARRLPRS